MRPGLLGVAIGLALADSSIVTLALPEVLREFDVGITTVAWVLTSFNLVLAGLAVPAAYVARRRPREAFAVGVVVFAVASLACGLAPSFAVLVTARCVQAVGAALIVTAALDLLSETLGSSERAVRVWVAAGILGAALGPAVGGVLTEVLGWESIFLAQVPVALLLLAALRGLRAEPLPAPVGRPHLTANAALLLVSGGLVAALFLLVLLLVDGWGMSPAAAGLVVTVMPLAAIVTGRLRPRALGCPYRDRQRRAARVRRAGGARVHAPCGLGVDDPTADPGRRGPRHLRRRPHRAGARRPREPGGARRLDARGPPRRGRPGSRPARPGPHHRARAKS